MQGIAPGRSFSQTPAVSAAETWDIAFLEKRRLCAAIDVSDVQCMMSLAIASSQWQSRRMTWKHRMTIRGNSKKCASFGSPTMGPQMVRHANRSNLPLRRDHEKPRIAAPAPVLR